MSSTGRNKKRAEKPFNSISRMHKWRRLNSYCRSQTEQGTYNITSDANGSFRKSEQAKNIQLSECGKNDGQVSECGKIYRKVSECNKNIAQVSVSEFGVIERNQDCENKRILRESYSTESETVADNCSLLEDTSYDDNIESSQEHAEIVLSKANGDSVAVGNKCFNGCPRDFPRTVARGIRI